jgi:oligoendopeptidase F
MSTLKVQRIPTREEVALADTWDLGRLYLDDEAWERDMTLWESRIPEFDQFRDHLCDGAEVLAACLAFDLELDRLSERLAYYALLKATEDQGNAVYQRMNGRFTNLATRAAEAASFIRPEITSIKDDRMAEFFDHKALVPYRLVLERILRFKPYTLTGREERLLAMQGEMAQASGKVFEQLHNVDLKFGLVENEKGEQVELGNSTFMQLLNSPQREVRKTAFHQYYQQFEAHENTLAAAFSGSIQKDVYYARVRGYDSALAASLFPDKVPLSVYDNLISTVRKHLPAVHRFYDLRRRKMELDEVHQYDTYVPILRDLEIERDWDQAVELTISSLQPLGSEYCEVLQKGLLGRWCDRYPNVSKQAGAFSAGSYDGDPYIMMNYQPTVFNDVFTLAHEAGHSMHSFYSSRHQPFQYYQYKIFVAEVASTFNEELLSAHLLQNVQDEKQRAYLVNRAIDDMRGTIIRQTMFAEFEKITHDMVEQGEPLTVQALKETYQKLLQDYFGPDFAYDEVLALECLRIPHFYRAFYVYKYATGMSAAIALSQRVLMGGEEELSDYLKFLQGGCSEDPLDLLRGAGVDMEQPEPVETALQHFENLVEELESLL